LKGHVLETGGKHPTHEGVIVGVDRHFDLVSLEVLDGISLFGVTIEAQYHKLL